MEIKVARKVLDENDTIAAENRRLFTGKGIFVVNLMNSPGSGKKATLERTLTEIMPRIPTGVIVGDICPPTMLTVLYGQVPSSSDQYRPIWGKLSSECTRYPTGYRWYKFRHPSSLDRRKHREYSLSCRI
ncbi:MAG: hypothetical protein SWO11_10795 [Thermodesulfobacteriota bacterium]|nr:hypothetical protein [Thermodesulfobacteriota bacterium]